MSLGVGARLGHYSVTAKLGKGGMGEVWEATDTKLNRQVALKILPEAFAADPDRLARFQREAQILASLNHPNIATIHGIEEADDTRALVLELVEGPTLADRINQGPIPMDEALPIANQIAEALEAAHEQGIIHRDLKPANIKLKPDGTAKVLDFGLAKAFQPEPTDDPSQSPTLTAAATASGGIIGTAAYMAPEQAKGKPVDQRADVWAFGAVLFEMLTGRRAFRGDDVSDTLVAVLTADVDFESLPNATTAGVHRLLRRCLARDPKRRLRNVADGILELDDEPLPHTHPRGPALSRGRSQLWLSALGITVVGVIGAALWIWGMWPVPPPPPRQDVFTVPLPEEVVLFGSSVAALSPDGQHLVFVGNRGGDTQLYLRTMNQIDVLPIAETQDAQTPFFSPDGVWIGFEVDGVLKKIRLAGGPPESICVLAEDMSARPGSWGSDDTIWLAGRSGLYQVPASGGVPQLVTTPDDAPDRVMGFVGAVPLPGGRGVLYTAALGGRDDGLLDMYRGRFSRAASLYIPATGEHRILAEEARVVGYATGGHVLVSRSGGTLWGLPFDLDRLEARAAPVLVREGLHIESGGATKAYVGADGTLAYVPGSDAAGRTLVWVNRDGTETPVGAPPRVYRAARLSPDDTRVAVEIVERDSVGIWTYHFDRGTLEPVTRGPGGTYLTPVWTPDGQSLVYGSFREADDAGVIYQSSADGVEETLELHVDADRVFAPWSWRDGSTLAISEFDRVGQSYDIGVLTPRSSTKWTQLMAEPYWEFHPAFSPDGRWLAYASQITGGNGLYISRYPQVRGDRWLVTDNRGIHPVWSRDGSELFYRSGTAMFSVTVQTNPDVRLGNPVLLFEDPYYADGVGQHYDVAADGRFLKIKHGGTGDLPKEIHIVRNWFQELTERVPIP